MWHEDEYTWLVYNTVPQKLQKSILSLCLLPEKKNVCWAMGLEVSWLTAMSQRNPGSHPQCARVQAQQSRLAKLTWKKKKGNPSFSGGSFFSSLKHQILHGCCTNLQKKCVVHKLSHRASISGHMSCWRTRNASIKLKDDSWTSLSLSLSRQRGSFFKIRSLWQNTRKHFASIGERLQQGSAWAEEFQGSVSPPWALTSYLSCGSIIRCLQSWPLHFFNNGFWSKSEFSLLSTCLHVAPDNNPHLAWEIWKGMFVLDLALVGWNRRRARSSSTAVFLQKWKVRVCAPRLLTAHFMNREG